MRTKRLLVAVLVAGLTVTGFAAGASTSNQHVVVRIVTPCPNVGGKARCGTTRMYVRIGHTLLRCDNVHPTPTFADADNVELLTDARCVTIR